MTALQELNDLRTYTFDRWHAFGDVSHAVLTRHGGVSTGPYASLNLSYSTQDEEAAVAANFAKVRASVPASRVISCWQVHGDTIAEVTEDSPDQILSCDALMTDRKGVALLIRHADCQPALFYDPTKQVIANVHCGWRGNVLNIYRKTITALQERYGCNPKDLHVAIGPSLGPAHAEFVNFREEFPEEFWPFETTPKHFNLWNIAQWQLEEAGIPTEQISIARICTYDNEADFFSYRREKESGRNGTLIWLN